jgi:hypothetical protein
MNYPKSLPKDQSGAAMQEYPAPYPALVSWQSANAVASSVISLNPNTQAMEIGAVGGQGIVIRWIPLTETAAVSPFASVVASGAGANFTHFVPAGTYRRFVVPRETMGQMAGGQIGSVNGLYQRVAWINAGATASSILANEY